VLFLGVLYHLESPLEALRRVRSVTNEGGLAVIETEAMEVPDWAHVPLCEFFSADQLNHDLSNWWAPNAAGLIGLCEAAGFRSVQRITPPPWEGLGARLKRATRDWFVATHLRQRLGWQPPAARSVYRYRLIVHAHA